MERYETYKESGIEWIGEIPEGWDVTRFNNACSSSLGKMLTNTPSTASSYLGYYLKAANVQEEGFNLDTVSKMYFDSGDEERYGINTGDLLVVEGGSVGLAHIWTGALVPCYIQNALHRVRSLECFYTMYLKYSLDLARYAGYIDLVCNKATIAHFTKEKLLATPLLAPPFAEQQAIADYLDAKTAEIDALVADCEREVGLLREYRKAVISEAVTKGLDPDAPTKDSGVEWIGEIPNDWEVVGFKTYLDGIIDYRGRTPEKVDDGIFLITGRNIKQGRIHYELSQEYMRPEEFDTIMSRGRLKVGNVLFTMEAPLGEAAIIDRDDCAAAQRIIQLCCNEDELFGAFLVYWIMSDEFQSDLQTYATGSTASGIKASKLGMLRLMHPPMEAQHSIADYLDAKTAEIDSFIDAKQTMADKLREYRKSLISEAVTGKFKVPGV